MLHSLRLQISIRIHSRLELLRDGFLNHIVAVNQIDIHLAALGTENLDIAGRLCKEHGPAVSLVNQSCRSGTGDLKLDGRGIDSVD
jgi:hypothetical protein